MKRALSIAVFMVFMSFLFQPVILAEAESQAKVLNINGEAKYLKKGSAGWLPLEMGTVFGEGDKIMTADNSEVILEFTGNKKTAEVVVRPNSEFTFETFRHDEGAKLDKTLLDVAVGGVLVKAEKLVGDSKFEVKTPTSIVGIRGTTFEVNVAKA